MPLAYRGAHGSEQAWADSAHRRRPRPAQAKAAQYPGNVFHLRREKGGQGKAHTLNHGLAVILEDDWVEALLITDADVIFEPDSLRKMARHLADPQVGAVTTYTFTTFQTQLNGRRVVFEPHATVWAEEPGSIQRRRGRWRSRRDARGGPGAARGLPAGGP